MDSTAGTTRDRHYGKTDWNGKEFSIIDTGGYTVNSEDIFEDEIRRQVILAIEEADVILFLVEVATGITDLDMMMADMLRRSSKKVLLVCNKVDNNDQIYASHEFYSLGLGTPYCISSMSGSGTGDLMDAILEALPADVRSDEEEDLPHIFSRFYRVDKARSREAGGSGLGLSIVSDAAALHGGSIEVRPNHPRGTVFQVTFPAYEGEPNP